jgi:immunity protein, SdpI family
MIRKYFFTAAAVTATTWLLTFLIYPRLSSQIPVHWNFSAQVDRYGSRENLFVMPAIMVVVVLLFAALPWLSPRRFEVNAFRSTYLYIMLLIVGLIGYLHALMVWAALSKPLDMSRSLFGALFLFLVLVGNVLGKVRRNFYIGVRTPWTLANEKVWYATHRFAARVCVVGGLVGLVSLILTPSPVFALVILISSALASVVYSLAYYKRLEGRNEL